MPAILQPPFGTDYLTPDGRVSDLWQRYFLALGTQVNTTLAPVDAQYWLSTANGSLTADRNIGTLSTGYLRITTALGIATPSSVATIPAADIAAGTAGISVTGNAATATVLANTRAINGVGFNGGSDITVPAAAATLTGSALPALDGSALTGLGNAATATVLQTARTINGVSFNGSANVTVPAAAATLTGTTLPALNGAALTGLLVTQISGLAWGTYTPTLTNTANLDASTAYQCQYLAVGNTVTVSGLVAVDPTTTATLTLLGISLPIASNFVAIEDCAGVAFALGVAGQGASVVADTVNDVAEMRWIAGDVANRVMSFCFTYQGI